MTQVSTGESEVVAKKPETTNEHEKPREKKERVRAPTKVVVRRLPPTLTKDAFINQISPLPEHDYLYFVRPDKSLGPFAFSRAYINFIKQEDIFTFKEQFDNYTFMDKKGNEYPAVVEFAPFQRLPKKRMGRKKDPKMGTLENDPAYVSFLEAREAKLAESGSAQHCPLEYFPPPEKKKITTTPLLDFLRQRRAERQRLRDERREERRRKEQERKRLKDADRERRRGSGKPESSSSRESTSDSVLKSSQEELEEQEFGEGNYLNTKANHCINNYKIEPRYWNLDYNDPRLYQYKDIEDDFCTFDEDTLFQNSDLLSSDMKCDINLKIKFDDAQRGLERITYYGNNQNLQAEESYRIGRRAIRFQDFILPVLEANRDKLKRIERSRKLKLAALKPEVPQPRVIKIFSLDCAAAKSNDYEFKLLVRPQSQSFTIRNNYIAQVQKKNSSIKENKSSYLKSDHINETYFRENTCVEMKKCLKTVLNSLKITDSFYKSLDKYRTKEILHCIIKNRRVKSAEHKRITDVSFGIKKSYSCPKIESYSNPEAPFIKICGRKRRTSKKNSQSKEKNTTPHGGIVKSKKNFKTATKYPVSDNKDYFKSNSKNSCNTAKFSYLQAAKESNYSDLKTKKSFFKSNQSHLNEISSNKQINGSVFCTNSRQYESSNAHLEGSTAVLSSKNQKNEKFTKSSNLNSNNAIRHQYNTVTNPNLIIPKKSNETVHDNIAKVEITTTDERVSTSNNVDTKCNTIKASVQNVWKIKHESAPSIPRHMSQQNSKEFPPLSKIKSKPPWKRNVKCATQAVPTLKDISSKNL